MSISKYFETRTRPSGERYTTLTDDCPDWLHDAVYSAHDGELPNDWRYETLSSIAALIDDGYDDSGNIADNLVDVYMSDLLHWLAGDINHVAYVDQATEDYGPAEGLETTIRQGQFLAIDQMASTILAAVQENVDDDGEGEQ